MPTPDFTRFMPTRPFQDEAVNNLQQEVARLSAENAQLRDSVRLCPVCKTGHGLRTVQVCRTGDAITITFPSDMETAGLVDFLKEVL